MENKRKLRSPAAFLIIHVKQQACVLTQTISSSIFGINRDPVSPPTAFCSIVLRNLGEGGAGGGLQEIKGGDILRLMKCLPILFTEDGSSAVYRMIGSFLFKKIANHLWGV